MTAKAETNPHPIRAPVDVAAVPFGRACLCAHARGQTELRLFAGRTEAVLPPSPWISDPQTNSVTRGSSSALSRQRTLPETENEVAFKKEECVSGHAASPRRTVLHQSHR
ncbi:hypothetical protein FQA47_006142, partial [Oryzias melastigma]